MDTTTQARRLRVFAFDPHIARQFRYARANQITIAVPQRMETRYGQPDVCLRAGPVGEYLEVVDYDPASGLFYDPVNLNRFVASEGLAPEDSDPQFHQQMVYAVAMQTIAAFESALGRVALWASREPRDDKGNWQPGQDETYVPRLRLYPHALREANAYYSPAKKAILFGYFAAGDRSVSIPQGSTVFTCLSHDIVAHEVTHALLDGMHSRFVEASNPDVLALHEAVADIVALFQHFSHPEVLRDQIARTRGDLEAEHLLGELAQEFGQALGRGGALRNALGQRDGDGIWRRRKPDRGALARANGPHARGAVLVAAVFDVFIAIYRARTEDLFRIATGGSGILSPGAIHADLANRLAQEAAKTAERVLRLCIRALDYCPPVDVRFGDYLRAIVTADHDLFPVDEHHYRIAIIESFLAWGIVPKDLNTVTTATLLWPSLDELVADNGDEGKRMTAELGMLIENPHAILDWIEEYGKAREVFNVKLRGIAQKIGAVLSKNEAERTGQRTRKIKPETPDTFENSPEIPPKYDADQILSQNLLGLGLEADREVEWWVQKLYAQVFWGLLTAPRHRALIRKLHLFFEDEDRTPPTIYRSEDHGLERYPTLQVQAVRMATRRGNRDQIEREYVVEVVQRRRGYFDPQVQRAKDRDPSLSKDKWLHIEPGERGDFTFRRGCTLLIDARTFSIRRVIRTEGHVADDAALERVRDYLLRHKGSPRNALDGGHFGDPLRDDDFAHLHRSAE